MYNLDLIYLLKAFSMWSQVKKKRVVEAILGFYIGEKIIKLLSIQGIFKPSFTWSTSLQNLMITLPHGSSHFGFPIQSEITNLLGTIHWPYMWSLGSIL